jgi:NADH-quinone oxidoreductase subunit H
MADILLRVLTWISNYAHALGDRWGVPGVVVTAVGVFVASFIIVTVPIMMTLALIYAERKWAGDIQARIGPARTGGRFGVLQTLADALKLFLKEDIVPAAADRWLFRLAPALVLLPACMAYLVIPWDRGVHGSDLSIGILYIAAVSSITVIGILLAGWASNNKWSLLGGLRSAAQMVSYEIPQALSIVAVVLFTGSLSMVDIVRGQQSAIHHWNLFAHPILWLPALVYLIAGIAEVNRVPFDLPEAESELVAGFATEYSGMKFALFFMAEYANMFLICAIFVTLFLGGWQSPFGRYDQYIPGFIWFLGKTWTMVFILIWIRWTLPRLRVDQLMDFAWKVLLPAGLIAIFLVGGFALL